MHRALGPYEGIKASKLLPVWKTFQSRLKCFVWEGALGVEADPVMGAGGSSSDTSDVSTNSRSRMRFTTFGVFVVVVAISWRADALHQFGERIC